MRVSIRQAGEADALALGPAMRAADAREALRATGLGPVQVLRESVAASEGRAWAAYFDGQPAALYGLVVPELTGGVAVPWLLTGEAVAKSPGAFLRIAKDVSDRWSAEFPTLIQYVDADYVQAQRFLRAIGFTIYPAVPHGVAQSPFCPAVRSRHV